ncbi:MULTISPECIES: hypothetical protein [Enterobacteriaceae]|uniref:Uncharacterized protein n=1 Tax=Cronobacter turicensis (strain DSM 18703 / CCUG 55852 / LMG 23827 / z3032) TaxID=693216 RepID=C9Y5N4_CROTZ|nr:MULTISPECIES: hypothetical protein [Enterobacteriaceae]EAS6517848.1 hypothetical protein [Salmonella enterica]ECC9895536.1 hypothetical protein [Salmonella enterica subsp. enterica serovar Soerenga]CBA34679.1 hypothetical protein Ctu_2p00060 [Cronobacter turicensis z3032]EBC2720635.1 hypothetical protein [Salmonella enterica]EBD5338819.1 hypothetical protein [Salmonella enterica]
MFLTKFHPLTHKVDALIIRDLKQSMPVKYWLFRLAEWAARIGILGFICVFICYFAMGALIQHAGEPVPPSLAEVSARAIIALLILFMVGTITRGALFSDLEKRVNEKKWLNDMQ